VNRKVHFKGVPVRLDGQLAASVTIERGPAGDGVFSVRPYRGRVYFLPLSVVAEIVAWKVAKAEVADR